MESAHAWLESITYQMKTLPHSEQNRVLGGPIALLKAHGSFVFEYCAREASQIFGGLAYTLVQGRIAEFHGGDGFYGYRHGLEFLVCAAPALFSDKPCEPATVIVPALLSSATIVRLPLAPCID